MQYFNVQCDICRVLLVGETALNQIKYPEYDSSVHVYYFFPDLNRTFPDNIQFRKTSNPCLQKALYNVLLAYGYHDPAVGYCQVMTV